MGEFPNSFGAPLVSASVNAGGGVERSFSSYTSVLLRLTLGQTTEPVDVRVVTGSRGFCISYPSLHHRGRDVLPEVLLLLLLLFPRSQAFVF